MQPRPFVTFCIRRTFTCRLKSIAGHYLVLQSSKQHAADCPPQANKRMPITMQKTPNKSMGRYQNTSDWSGSPIRLMMASKTYMAAKTTPTRVVTTPSIMANQERNLLIYTRLFSFAIEGLESPCNLPFPASPSTSE